MLLVMDTYATAPLLSRVKSWQLVGLGLSGWCTLYSVAILSWGASSALIGNAQGGCFAVSMGLAGLEAKRYNKKAAAVPVDPLLWITGISTERVNQAVMQILLKKNFTIERCHPSAAELGFGVRAVTAGRTLVFETERWREAVIDLAHAQSTEENRKKASADLAVIVAAGNPDEAAQAFAKVNPVNFLAGEDLKDLLETPPPAAETPVEKKA